MINIIKFKNTKKKKIFLLEIAQFIFNNKIPILIYIYIYINKYYYIIYIINVYKNAKIFKKQLSDFHTYKRIGGSIIGETAFSGLIKLMTNYSKVYNAGKQAFLKGDNRKVDMLVEDIYGDDL